MYIKPKKSLGQNFLTDKNIQNKILKACNLSCEDVVLEIGSGKGDLTAAIAGSVKKVFALEIDQRLCPLLKQRLIKFDNCQVIQADILKFDLSKFLKEEKISGKIKVIGNIPYYISSPIIEHLITHRQAISAAFITVQEEFARRVISPAGSKEYGSFSCFVQYYCRALILFKIGRNCFRPAPNVESCFLALEFSQDPRVLVRNEEGLFKLIRRSFNQRRKTLRNSLEGFVDQARLSNFLEQAGLNKNIRPELISLEQFAALSDFLES